MKQPVVMVTGSRDWPCRYQVEAFFSDLTPGILICGGCRGVDTWAETVCRGRGWVIHRFPADWNTYGRAAGFIRNNAMLAACKKMGGKVVAFWDGKSRGTKHAIDEAGRLGLPLTIL